MSEALTKPEYGQTDIQKGGLGFGKSRFFELKPDYIALTQNMIANWNAANGPRPTPGKLRTGAGQEFERMKIVMLFQPVDWANYYLEGTKTFSSENLLCFSRNLEIDNNNKIIGGTPHSQARQPQALACAGCNKSSWTKTKDQKDIPPACKSFAHLFVVDRLTKFVYNLDIKGTSFSRKLKDGFWNAMFNLSRQMSLLRLTGKNPNIFDYSFDIYGVPQQNGQYYTFGFSKPALIPEEDKAHFGELFLEFIDRFNQNQTESEDLAAKAEAQVASETVKVEAQIVDQPSSTAGPVVDGDYVTI